MTERLNLIIKHLNLTVGAFAASINVSQTLIHYYTKGRTPSLEVVGKIVQKYPNISCRWLITGEGEMLINTKSANASLTVQELKQHGYAPFYSDSQVRLNQYDLTKVKQNEEPSGWVKMVSGVIIDALFPIVGCSMEPKICANDTIGVLSLNNWGRIDPDKVYLVVTNNDKMIKHLQIDEENPDIIWAVSGNYTKFKIHVNEIKNIYLVVWVGRFL